MSEEKGKEREEACGAVPKKARRKQKYRPEWEKQFPWVEPAMKDACKAMCLICSVEITAQLTTLKLHENTAKHKKMCAPSSSKKLMESFTSARGDNETSKSDSVKAAEIRLTAFMVEHNISFRVADHLCQVLKGCFSDSAIAKELKMKRTKCQRVCGNVMAHSHKQELINILKQNKFSILVDESTDISVSQNLCIMTRAQYSDKGDMHPAPPEIQEPTIPPYEEKVGEPLHLKRARLQYQSRKRGMLENGLILSSFAHRFLPTMTENQLALYDRLINLPSNDWEIYYWATGVQPTPQEFDNEVMTMLKEFVKNSDRENRTIQPNLH